MEIERKKPGPTAGMDQVTKEGYSHRRQIYVADSGDDPEFVGN